MRLDSEFIQLPIRFDAERLATEISQFDEDAWKPHPQGFAGNWALSLIALAGDPHSDDVSGPMRPTPHLDRCPYIRQVLASFHSVWGRTRLMRIDGNGEAGAHADVNYYWAQRARVHVPIVTRSEVLFECGSKSVHMAPGEAWIFDTWRRHNVTNPHPTRRIHLVADTVVSAAFWSLVRQGSAGAEPAAVAWNPLERPIFLVCPPRSGSSLLFETLSQAPSAWTIGGESHAVFEGVPGLHPAQRRFHSNRLAA